jgi:hypothetical protein
MFYVKIYLTAGVKKVYIYAMLKINISSRIYGFLVA